MKGAISITGRGRVTCSRLNLIRKFKNKMAEIVQYKKGVVLRKNVTLEKKKKKDGGRRTKIVLKEQKNQVLRD